MNYLKTLFLSILLIFFQFIIFSTRLLAVNFPDLILYNGKIITVDSNFSIAEAVAIKGEYFYDVGSNDDILKLAGQQTKKINLNGKTVLPGLIDAHAHPEMAAVSELFEEIPDVHSINELLEHIRHQVKIKKPGEWIVHQKFFPTRLKEMRQPTKEELDNAAPENPVFLNGTYGGMINSCAMKVSGITKEINRHGIIKNLTTGEPTGFIRASAFALLKVIPSKKISYEQRLTALEEMLKRYNRAGITGVTDGMQTQEALKMYSDLRKQRRLPVRICMNIMAPDFISQEKMEAELREWGFYTGFGDHNVRIAALKVLLDGGILTGTAYMREPWGEKAKEIYGIENPEYRGILNIHREQLTDIVTTANSFGWKFTAHCTGGGAMDTLLAAYEKANRQSPIRPRRFSIIHGNFFTPDAIRKCAELGIIADCQPAWFYKDAEAMNYILGKERIKEFLPLKSLLDSGVILNGGSDHMVKFDSYSSINPYNPFLGMWTVITRKTERGAIIEPSQAISRKEALKMYTINNAYGTFEEDVKGSIEPGKLADLIVIDKDFLTCHEDSIRTIQVEMTMVGGRMVYSIW